MRHLTCLRCQTPMSHLRDEKLQLGQTGWVLGDLPNLWAGAMEVSIYMCSSCGKIEFFRCEDEDDYGADRIAQVRCPRCGKMHDMDYPKCPYCKYPD